MAALSVKLNAAALEAWAGELSTRGLSNALRRATDQSATAARRVALDTIAKDIGVPKTRLRDAVTKVKRTSLTSLSASFEAKKANINIISTAGAQITRGIGLVTNFGSPAAVVPA